MTSSFTNLVLAGRALGGDPQACEARALGLARAAAGLLRERADALDARRAERLRLGRLPGQRLPPRLRPRGRAQDAGDERGRGLHLRRVLPRPAARAHVGDPPGHAGGGLPLLRPAGARLRARTSSASWTARGSARGASSWARGFPPASSPRPTRSLVECGALSPVRGRGPDRSSTPWWGSSSRSSAAWPGATAPTRRRRTASSPGSSRASRSTGATGRGDHLKKVLCAGEINVDLVLQGYTEFPVPGKEVLVQDFASWSSAAPPRSWPWGSRGWARRSRSWAGSATTSGAATAWTTWPAAASTSRGSSAGAA